MSSYNNLGFNPLSLIGADAESIKKNAGNIFKFSALALAGILTFYIVVKDPRVVGRYIRLPLDAAKGAVNMAGTAVKVGADAIMVIPNALSRK